MTDDVTLPEGIETAWEYYTLRGTEEDYNDLRAEIASALAPLKARVHCEVCGCTYVDDGLNPAYCPYCVGDAHARSAHAERTAREVAERERDEARAELEHIEAHDMAVEDAEGQRLAAEARVQSLEADMRQIGAALCIPVGRDVLQEARKWVQRFVAAEARVRELEAAVTDALAVMEAGGAPDVRWLPAGGSDLLSAVSDRYRSLYAILDAARQAGEVDDGE